MCMFCGGTGAGPQGGLLAFGTMAQFRAGLCGLETRHRQLRLQQLEKRKQEIAKAHAAPAPKAQSAPYHISDSCRHWLS